MSLTTPDTPSPPTVPGGYLLRRLLGRGAFGEVWLAEAPGGVEVAVKILHRSVRPDEAERELEALRLIKGLRHQSLLSLQAYYALEDRLVIVLELADRSLPQRLAECRAAGQPGIPAAELLAYFREVAEALDYLHENQVLHRDVKPDNILLTGRHAKLADYGLARLLEQHSLQIASMAGTPPYMAPEVFGGRVSRHSDQYSLAVTYAELRLGRRLISGSNLLELMVAHQEARFDLTPLSVPEQEVLRKALAREPSQRYRSCSAFIQALSRATPEGAGGNVPGPPPAAPGPAPDTSGPSRLKTMNALQNLLDGATDGQPLRLSPANGEFQGPVVIRAPLVLDGQGATIWAERGPVISVLAGGVVLNRLNIEVTANDAAADGEAGCALQVAPGLPITLDHVAVRGSVRGLDAEEGDWDYPRSVKLGALKAKRGHRFTVRLVVPVPCALVSKIDGLQVQPTRLRGGAVEEVVLKLDPLSPGTLVRGEVWLQTGLLTRRVRVTGTVPKAEGSAVVFGDGQVVWEPQSAPSEKGRAAGDDRV
ncbi:MAG TPA: serine/threonine-protein kinase, partial [Gemmataceae bacterium]|nr:serine/threonine-protein kinase [Gemmataceae bacterium]